MLMDVKCWRCTEKVGRSVYEDIIREDQHYVYLACGHRARKPDGRNGRLGEFC